MREKQEQQDVSTPKSVTPQDNGVTTSQTDVVEQQMAENYINSRLKAETKYYDDRADGYRDEYMSNQTLIIIVGAIIPIVSVLEVAFDSCELVSKWHLGSIISALLSAAIAIYAGIDKLHQTQNRWNTMRFCAQMLKREENLYRNRVGEYEGKTDKEAKQLLVQKTEGILYYDITSTMQISKKGVPDIGSDKERAEDK